MKSFDFVMQVIYCNVIFIIMPAEVKIPKSWQFIAIILSILCIVPVKKHRQ